MTMSLVLRLFPWLRRATASRDARAPARPPPAVVDLARERTTDEQVMRRRVQHFCEEFPPERPTR